MDLRGSALLSTAGDYIRFCQMLLNGGELGGTRCCRPHVALMASTICRRHHYGPQMRAMFGRAGAVPEERDWLGLGFAVRTHAGRNALPGWRDYSGGVRGLISGSIRRQQLIPS